MVTSWPHVWTQQPRILEILEVGRNQFRCMMTWMRSLKNQVWCCQTSALLPTTRPFGSAQFVWLLKLVPPHDRLEIGLNPVHFLSRRLLRAIHLKLFVQVAFLNFFFCSGLLCLHEGFWSGPDYTTRPPVLSCAASTGLATPRVAACCRHPRPDTRGVPAVERRPWRSTMPSARHSRGPCLLRPAARPPTGYSTTCVPSQTWRRAGRRVGLEMRGPEPDRAPNQGLHHSIGLPPPPQVR